MMRKRPTSSDEISEAKAELRKSIRIWLGDQHQQNSISWVLFCENFFLGETCVDGEKTQRPQCVKGNVLVMRTVKRKQAEMRESTQICQVINICKTLFYGCFSGNSGLGETSVDGERTQKA